MIFKTLERLRYATLSPLGKVLYDAFKNDRWILSEYVITHEQSKVSLWIGNGWTFFNVRDKVYPEDPSAIPFRERYFLWRRCAHIRRGPVLEEENPNHKYANIILLAKIRATGTQEQNCF